MALPRSLSCINKAYFETFGNLKIRNNFTIFYKKDSISRIPIESGDENFSDKS